MHQLPAPLALPQPPSWPFLCIQNIRPHKVALSQLFGPVKMAVSYDSTSPILSTGINTHLIFLVNIITIQYKYNSFA